MQIYQMYTWASVARDMGAHASRLVLKQTLRCLSDCLNLALNMKASEEKNKGCFAAGRVSERATGGNK